MNGSSTHKIYGYDNNQQAIAIANANVKAAGVSKDVEIKFQPFQQFMQPTEKSLMMMNPPYGERISSPDILGLYRTIGERLKHQFVDNDAWIISHREELFDEIGLKPSLKIPIYNGSLECEFRKYQIFSGRYNDLRSDGGQIKSEDELKQMGEKHRFKEHREDFKRRFSDDDEEDVPTGHFRVRGVRDDDDRRGGRRFDRDKESRFGGRDRDRESRFGGRDRDKDSRFGGRDRDKDSRFGGRDRDKDSHFGGRDRDKDSHFGGFNHDRDNHFGGRDRDRDRDNEHRAPRHFDHSDDRGGRSFSSGRKPFGGGGRRDSGFKPRGGDYNRRRDNNNEDED
jgi:putative N6-adenine-specific DNA methylase